MEFNVATLEGIANLLYLLNDHVSRTTKGVHVDNMTVWGAGEHIGMIKLDGDTYVFEPTSKGAST